MFEVPTSTATAAAAAAKIGEGCARPLEGALHGSFFLPEARRPEPGANGRWDKQRKYGSALNTLRR